MKPIWTLWPECQVTFLEETWHHPYGEEWWWQHHAVEMFFSGRDWETSQDRGRDEQSNVQRDPWWKLAPERSGPQTGGEGTPPTDDNPLHTAKTMQKWLWDKSLNVLEWHSQSPDLNPIEHLWRDLKTTVQKHSPPNLTELKGSAEKNGRNSPNTGVPSL